MGQDRSVSFFKDTDVSLGELKEAPAGTAPDDETPHHLTGFVCEGAPSPLLSF